MKTVNITKVQLRELDLLIEASKHLLTESVEGVAQVAKRVQVYLGCSFKEAVSVLNTIIKES